MLARGPEGGCLLCLLETSLAEDTEEGTPAGSPAIPPESPVSWPSGTPAPSPATAVRAGNRFGHFEIDAREDGSPHELGRGAIGITYRATDTTLHCAVALKVINLGHAAHPRSRARFLREARAAAGLRHPHVASVFYFGERPDDGQPFYAMELVEGETLHARVRRCGGLPVNTVLEIGTQMADALAAAEARGLTHRDLKPANVMLVEGERINVKVIDFGLAKAASTHAGPAADPPLTGAEEFVGTPAFASPEQFGGDGIDARSDFYALGATLWYALTGSAPFTGKTLDELRERQLQGNLPMGRLRAVRVPEALVSLLRSLLSADPVARPQTTRELVTALNDCRQRASARRAAPGRAAGLAVLLGLGLMLAMAGWWFSRRPPSPAQAAPVTSSPVPARSIAVLPFENRSGDKENAVFVDGVQDSILDELARLADLTVISRHSVVGYRDPVKRPPPREIGRELGVAYLLEGSATRADGRFRLSVQLIDAPSGQQVWSDSFDENLPDVFSVQGKVANTIAGKLQARLSDEERAGLSAAPTRDMAAYELYLHARELYYNFEPNTSKWEPLYEAARLLDEATTRDPDYYDAWVLLTTVHGGLLWFNADPTPAARTALAERTLAQVRRLRPDAGETHLAAATYFYNVHQPERGRPELDLAREKLPNDPRVLLQTGSAGMIDGRWGEALSALEKARTLNPRHLRTLNLLSIVYEALRRYDDAKRVVEAAMTAGLNPDYLAMRHGVIVQNQTGDTTELRAIFARNAGLGTPTERTVIVRWDMAMRDHDFDRAERELAGDPRQEFTARTHTVFPRFYLTGVIALARGDLAAAHDQLERARPTFAEATRIRPEDASAWMYLADLDARLGRKADAEREGTKSMTLLPISRDAAEGARLAEGMGWIYAMNGEKDRALTYLESLENVPSALEYGFEGRHPDFDIFRGEPRFQALLEAIRKPVDLSKFNPADFPPPTPMP